MDAAASGPSASAGHVLYVSRMGMASRASARWVGNDTGTEDLEFIYEEGAVTGGHPQQIRIAGGGRGEAKRSQDRVRNNECHEQDRLAERQEEDVDEAQEV